MKAFLPYLRLYQLPVALSGLLIALYFTHFFGAVFGLELHQETALVIMLLTTLLWITEPFPLFVTSLGVLVASILWLMPQLHEVGIAIKQEDFLNTFFNDITLLFMGGFTLSAALNKYGLARITANWMLKRTGVQPASILWGIILVSATMSMWISNTATTAMMFGIIAPLLAGLPPGSPFAKSMAIAIPFSANIGGLGTPIGTLPNAIAIAYLRGLGLEVTFFQWMIVAVPVTFVLLWALWRLLLRFFPPGDLVMKLETKTEKEKLTPRQYIVIGVFILTIIGWLSSGSTGMTTGTVGLTALFVIFALGLLKIPDFRNIPWDILFMLGGGLCLGLCLSRSGLAQIMAGTIPVGGGFWIIFLIIIILTALMTTFMSNTATANLLIPIAVSMPDNELALIVAITLLCSTSMALPISTPPNAIAFGSGLLQARDMVKVGLRITVAALLAAILGCAVYLYVF